MASLPQGLPFFFSFDENYKMQIGVLILAAGFSKRMGENKALLNFNNNYTFLDQIVSQYYLAGIHQVGIISQEGSLPLHIEILNKKICKFNFLKTKNPI